MKRTVSQSEMLTTACRICGCTEGEPRPECPMPGCGCHFAANIRPVHGLDYVHEFSTHTVGWRDLPEGGQVPIIAPIEVPYCRWYCKCGAVGGRSRNEVTARENHRDHVERVREEAS